MQGLVIPTREHLYQFMDAMAGGAYGGYLEGIVDTWVMKFSTFNPEQGWLKSPFADPIKDMYPQYRDMMNKHCPASGAERCNRYVPPADAGW